MNNMFFSSFGMSFKREYCPKIYKLVLCIIFITGFHASVQSQESLFPELSYPFLEKLIFTAKQNYPRVKSFDRKINIANLNVQKANLSWLDFLTFSAFYSPSNSNSVTLTNTTYTGTQIGLFINFGQIAQKPNLVKQSKEELAIAKLTADEYLITIETEVKARYFKYMQALTTLKIKNQVLIDVNAVYKQIKYKFERGESTFLDYSTALTQSAKQREEIIVTESAVLVAKSSLEELLGKKLEEIK